MDGKEIRSREIVAGCVDIAAAAAAAISLLSKPTNMIFVKIKVSNNEKSDCNPVILLHLLGVSLSVCACLLYCVRMRN